MVQNLGGFENISPYIGKIVTDSLLWTRGGGIHQIIRFSEQKLFFQ
jgi:hypothetical protein